MCHKSKKLKPHLFRSSSKEKAVRRLENRSEQIYFEDLFDIIQW